MAAVLDSVWKYAFTDTFAKSPAAGIVVGVILLMLKDGFERHRVRRTLLRALNTEARTTWKIIADLLEQFPKREEADAIVDAVTNGTLTFEILDGLPAGFALFVPAFPLSDTITKLKPKEAEAAIHYFDAWTRLAEFERRVVTTYTKLIDLAPEANKEDRKMQVREVAVQVRGNLRQLLAAVRDLSTARRDLERVTATGLRWNPLAILRSRPKAELPDTFDFPDWTPRD